MNKFKVGDRVIPKRIAPFGSVSKSKYLDNIYTVVNISDYSPYNIFIFQLNGTTGYSWAEEELELEINNINQICVVCKIPCPHQNPNQTDNTYICLGCVIIKDISRSE
jgi:hypothetical protein